MPLTQWVNGRFSSLMPESLLSLCASASLRLIPIAGLRVNIVGITPGKFRDLHRKPGASA